MSCISCGTRFVGFRLPGRCPQVCRSSSSCILSTRRKYGVDATLKQLGRYERKRFKELLKAMPPTVRHPLSFRQAVSPRVLGEVPAVLRVVRSRATRRTAVNTNAPLPLDGWSFSAYSGDAKTWS